jgi:hypothetical protein
MSTNHVYEELLNIQDAKGYLTLEDLPDSMKHLVPEKHKNKQLCLNRRNFVLYYKGRMKGGLTGMIPCHS